MMPEKRHKHRLKILRRLTQPTPVIYFECITCSVRRSYWRAELQNRFNYSTRGN